MLSPLAHVACPCFHSVRAARKYSDSDSDDDDPDKERLEGQHSGKNEGMAFIIDGFI